MDPIDPQRTQPRRSQGVAATRVVPVLSYFSGSGAVVVGGVSGVVGAVVVGGGAGAVGVVGAVVVGAGVVSLGASGAAAFGAAGMAGFSADGGELGVSSCWLQPASVKSAPHDARAIMIRSFMASTPFMSAT